ncbi:MAG TPA: MBL fold metallo-hydrolase [Verrucomicrobiales bacterium]|nr:MBL fold metallo-hydrolase [Verrucomicrobiales bacterium]
MTSLILRDSAKIQEHDNERINRKRQRAGKGPIDPLFSMEDVEAVLKQLQPVPYNERVEVAPGMYAIWSEAGHILGASSIRLIVREEGREKTVVFSGDLGPKKAPLLRDPKPFDQADLLFMESTYGDRDHRPKENTIRQFAEIIHSTLERKGKMLIPAFAVGRTQELLYHLALFFRNKEFEKFPIFIDSPMAIEATKIYIRHPELFDRETRELRKDHPLHADLSSVKTTASADESKALNDVPGPCMILAGAGICNAGRILHHFKQNLWKSQTSVIIAGFQAYGSLGRRLLEGAKKVKIFGETIVVRAEIHSLGGLSAHAGQTELLEWFSRIAPSKPRTVLIHGESRGRIPMAEMIQKKFGIQAELPSQKDTFEL